MALIWDTRDILYEVGLEIEEIGWKFPDYYCIYHNMERKCLLFANSQDGHHMIISESNYKADLRGTIVRHFVPAKNKFLTENIAFDEFGSLHLLFDDVWVKFEIADIEQIYEYAGSFIYQIGSHLYSAHFDGRIESYTGKVKIFYASGGIICILYSDGFMGVSRQSTAQTYRDFQVDMIFPNSPTLRQYGEYIIIDHGQPVKIGNHKIISITINHFGKLAFINEHGHLYINSIHIDTGDILLESILSTYYFLTRDGRILKVVLDLENRFISAAIDNTIVEVIPCDSQQFTKRIA
jgi:hypothetical protein